MTAPRDDADLPLPKRAEWVSPWSFDDEWEIAEARRQALAEKRRREREEKNPASVSPARTEASKTAASALRTKSFKEYGATSEPVEAAPLVVPAVEPVESAVAAPVPTPVPTPAPTPVAAPIPTVKTVPDVDYTRFQPPPVVASPPIIARPSPQPSALTEPAPHVAQPPTHSAATAAMKPAVPPAARVTTFEPEVEKANDEPEEPPHLQPPAPRSTKPVSVEREFQHQPVFSWNTPIILSLGMLGFMLLAWIYLHDSSGGSDSDLRITVPVDQTPKIQAPERLKVFLNAVKRAENRELDMKPAWNWDTPTLAMHVMKNGDALDNLRDLLEDFDWHAHHAAWHGEDLGEHPAWPHVRFLLQAQAAYLMRHGNQEAALIAVIDMAELSRRMHDLWAWPSFMLRAQEMHMACVQSAAEILRQVRMSSSSLAAFQNEFHQCAPTDTLLQGALSAFYVHQKKLLFGEKSGVPVDTLPRGITQGRPARLFFKKHETLGLFADAIRRLRNEIVLAPYAALGDSTQTVSNIRRSRPLMIQPNGAGAAYFSEQIEPYLNIPERHGLAKARHGLLLCLFAVRRYVVEQQKLPPDLASLVPNYLLEVPTDPFSGEAMQYDPLKGLLYSVGTDLIKSGGKITDPPLIDVDEPTVDLGIAIATPAAPVPPAPKK